MIPVIYSEEFLTDYMTVDCECPERAWMIYSRIQSIARFIEPDPCNLPDLLLCHSKSLIESVKRDETVYKTACKSVGGAIKAAIMSLEQPTFALIRPPGHHAGRNFNGGFCFFNNMAIAIKKLLSLELVKNALVVDIDLHYGNGTEDILKKDERITFRNIDSGTREDFLKDFSDALEDSKTFDVVGCSVGFDTYVRDWGGMLFTEDYRKLGNMLTTGNPRAFAVLEGGYYLADLGANALAFLEGMMETCS